MLLFPPRAPSAQYGTRKCRKPLTLLVLVLSAVTSSPTCSARLLGEPLGRLVRGQRQLADGRDASPGVTTQADLNFSPQKDDERSAGVTEFLEVPTWDSAYQPTEHGSSQETSRPYSATNAGVLAEADLRFRKEEGSAGVADFPELPTEDSAYQAQEQARPQGTSQQPSPGAAANAGGVNPQEASEGQRGGFPVSRRFHYALPTASDAKGLESAGQDQEGVSRRLYYSGSSTSSAPSSPKPEHAGSSTGAPSRRLQGEAALRHFSPKAWTPRDASAGPINRQVFNLLKGRSYGKVYGRVTKRAWSYGKVYGTASKRAWASREERSAERGKRASRPSKGRRVAEEGAHESPVPGEGLARGSTRRVAEEDGGKGHVVPQSRQGLPGVSRRRLAEAQGRRMNSALVSGQSAAGDGEDGVSSEVDVSPGQSAGAGLGVGASAGEAQSADAAPAWQLVIPSGGGACLDGSPPGYYLRPGFGDGKTQWLLFLEGGAWCFSWPECVQRSRTPLGTSARLEEPGATKPSQYNRRGILSTSPEENAEFHNFNIAIIAYCDGAARLGRRGRVGYLNSTLVFDGYDNLQQVLQDMIQQRGMDAATSALVAGSSAGAHSVAVLCDWIAGQLPATTKTKCLMDAGFFLDAKDRFGDHSFRKGMRKMQTLHGAESPSQDCLDAHPAKTWACLFPEYSVNYMKTPMFIVNSLYDYVAFWFISRHPGVKRPWPPNQVMDCVRNGGDICSEGERQSYIDYGAKMLEVVTQFLEKAGEGSGAFLMDGAGHTEIDTWDYNSLSVNGTSMRQAIVKWFFD